MQNSKILETMSGMILNRLQPKLAAKSVANEMQPVRGEGVRTALRFQMAARKSFETIPGMILNLFHPKFAAKSVANEMQCLKAKYWPVLTDRASILEFKDFWAVWLGKQSSTVLLTKHPYFDLEDLS